MEDHRRVRGFVGSGRISGYECRGDFAGFIPIKRKGWYFSI